MFWHFLSYDNFYLWTSFVLVFWYFTFYKSIDEYAIMNKSIPVQEVVVAAVVTVVVTVSGRGV